VVVIIVFSAELIRIFNFLHHLYKHCMVRSLNSVSCEFQDGLGLCVIILVVSSLTTSLVGNGIQTVKGSLFPFFPNDFSTFVGIFYIFNYICNFQSFSNFRIYLVV